MVELIQIGAINNLLLVVFHLLFWRLFNWKSDLVSLLFLNCSTMQVLNICLTIVFAIFAYISFMRPQNCFPHRWA